MDLLTPNLVPIDSKSELKSRISYKMPKNEVELYIYFNSIIPVVSFQKGEVSYFILSPTPRSKLPVTHSLSLPETQAQPLR